MLKPTLLLLLASFLCVACGTDTGNPGVRTALGAGDTSQTTMGRVADATCTKLFSCHENLVKQDCTETIFLHEPMVPKLGFTNEDFLNMAAIAKAEGNELKFDLDSVRTCLSDIQSLPCDDPGVETAFKEGDENPYSQIEEMIPLSCQTMEKVEDQSSK